MLITASLAKRRLLYALRIVLLAALTIPAVEDDSVAVASANDAEADAPGSLTISSTPAGALTLLNGMPVGETPVRIDSLSAGRYRIRIEKQGFLAKAATVLVNAGADGQVAFELLKPVSIAVIGEPAGARVMLDTLDMGAMPLYREGLVPRSYRLRVTKDGFSGRDTTLALAGGSSDTVRIALLPHAAGTDDSSTEPPHEASPAGLPRRIATRIAIGAFVLFSVVLLSVDMAFD